MTLLVGHLTHKVVSEMTYVSSGTLNTTIPYHTWSFVRPFTCLLVHYGTKLVNVTFWKQMRQFFCKLSLVVHGVRSD